MIGLFSQWEKVNPESGIAVMFIGHEIEGKKPSFLKDVQFLLIGPAWLMHFIYQKLNIRY